MAHNGKVSLTDYDLSQLHEWEIEKIKKAVEKRQRRDKREEDERKAKAKRKKQKEKNLNLIQKLGQEFDNDKVAD